MDQAAVTPTILFVCTANICRSPMAEAILHHLLEARHVPAEILSAGLLEDGRPVSDGSVRVLQERGIDVSEHRSQVLTAHVVGSASLVLCMERRHVQESVLLAREAWARTFTLKELVRRGQLIGPRGNESLPEWVARAHAGRLLQDLLGFDDSDDVRDPYGGPDEGYGTTFRELHRLLSKLVDLMWPNAAG